MQLTVRSDVGTPGARRPRALSLGLAGLTAALVILATAAPAWAASPSSGSVGPGDASTAWTGQSYVAGATASPAACWAGGDTLCDHFSLSVPASSSYWDTHTGSVRISIAWGSSSNNFDLYVYSGGLVGSSASDSSTGESVSISNPSGTYSVVVVPKLVTNSGYHGSASFQSQEKPAPDPSPTGSGGGGTGGGGGGSGGGSGGGGGTGSGGTGGGSGSGGGTTSGGGGSGSGSGGGGTTGGTGSGDTGSVPTGGTVDTPVVVQPGSQPPFGSPNGPIFNYDGPYHFDPPFSVGADNPGGAVMPPQSAGAGGGGEIVIPRGGGGHVVQPPQSSSGGSAEGGSTNSSDSDQTVRVRTAGTTPDRGGFPNLLWPILAVGLLLLLAVGYVIFEDEDDAMKARAAATAAKTTDAGDTAERQVPPAGPFLLLGFAVRRVLRERRRSDG
jgi:hypothetical protein